MVTSFGISPSLLDLLVKANNDIINLNFTALKKGRYTPLMPTASERSSHDDESQNTPSLPAKL
ncbi:hypothetical protein D3C76_1884740 [compost metagenome]